MWGFKASNRFIISKGFAIVGDLFTCVEIILILFVNQGFFVYCRTELEDNYVGSQLFGFSAGDCDSCPQCLLQQVRHTPDSPFPRCLYRSSCIIREQT